MKTSKFSNTQKLVILALLTAIVVILQLFGAMIRFGPFSVSLVLMPIAIGAALVGVYAGGWLGLVFGCIVLMSPDTNLFWAINPVGTVTVVILKGVLAGLAAGAAYKIFARKNMTAAAIAAAAVCPIVNTGVFLIGAYVFFLPAITQWGAAAGYASAGTYIIFVMVGVNFLFEFCLNLVLSPVIVRLIQYGLKMKVS